MTRQATVYSILVASPSDVADERKAISEVIYQWNAAHSRSQGVILEPVLWETHATPEMGDRPQALINKQLIQDCDILVGDFWTKIGTHTGEAESGTVEEIQEFEKAGKPVLLYFSLAPLPQSVDVDQWNRLHQFRREVESRGLVARYDSISDLREQLLRHLTRTIGKLIGSPSDNTSQEEHEIPLPQRQLLDAPRSQFQLHLSRTTLDWAAERDSDPINIDQGKHILDDIYRAFLDFVVKLRTQVPIPEGSRMFDMIAEATKRLRAIQRHILTMGGTSFRAFWQEGDEIIGLLQAIDGEIDHILDPKAQEAYL